MSHTERSVPQSGQRAIQARDSASMDAAQLRGTSDVNSLWMKVTTQGPKRAVVRSQVIGLKSIKAQAAEARNNTASLQPSNPSSCTLKRSSASVHVRRGSQPAERANSWNSPIVYLYEFSVWMRSPRRNRIRRPSTRTS
jgi:hypothetical protein